MVGGADHSHEGGKTATCAGAFSWVRCSFLLSICFFLYSTQHTHTHTHIHTHTYMHLRGPVHLRGGVRVCEHSWQSRWDEDIMENEVKDRIKPYHTETKSKPRPKGVRCECPCLLFLAYFTFIEQPFSCSRHTTESHDHYRPGMYHLNWARS